ncbi:helix-turn-helix domain-containing protein [Ruegeria sp. SCP11]|uniref:helix-turn-helix domain-containing protein n=1 Tax=Ruegeria sp. SCP11 TaxID=3141378 RepID=UPI0033365559
MPDGLSTRIRLVHVADLLRTTKYGLQEVAEASGYRSAAQFSYCFLKAYSLRPEKYRRTNG